MLDGDGPLRTFLKRQYGVREASLRLLIDDEDKRVYRLDQIGKPPWLLRVTSSESRSTSAHHDAAVLTLLERLNYPAPRVVRALSGAAVASDGTLHAEMTTFVDGRPPSFSPDHLGLIGEAVGRLHALPLPLVPERATSRPSALRPASMLPRREIAASLSWLAEVRHEVRQEQRPRFDALEAACQALNDGEDLPSVLIHNDCHPGNCIMTAERGAVLIDWEGAGLGPAVIDVGFLLVSCEIDAFRPNRLPPDPARVQAVVDGYCRHHHLTTAELD